jgi:hypothetical protein
MVAAGQADPELKDLSGRTGQAAFKPYILQELADRYPDFNVVNAVGDKKYWNNPQTKKQLQVMTVVDNQLPVMEAASNEMKRTGIPVLDSRIINALAGMGYPNAANYIAASTTSVEDIAKGISGGQAMTDDQLRLAQRLLPPGASPQQLDAVIGQIKNGIRSRKISVYREGGVYGKIAARNDKFLDDVTRQAILTDTEPPIPKMPGATSATAAPQVKTQAEYDAIPKGGLYIDTDGATKRKK